MSSAPGSTFVYVTYIRTRPEKLWRRRRTPNSSRSTGSMRCESDFKPGSPWNLSSPTAASRTSARSWRPIRPSASSSNGATSGKPELKAEGHSTCATERGAVALCAREAHHHAFERQRRALQLSMIGERQPEEVCVYPQLEGGGSQGHLPGATSARRGGGGGRGGGACFDMAAADYTGGGGGREGGEGGGVSASLYSHSIVPGGLEVMS